SAIIVPLGKSLFQEKEMLTEVWRINMLGGWQVRQNEIVLERFRTRKTAVLLAYLAYHSQRAHAREELADLFWPDATPELGLKSLGVALSSLRHALEPPGVIPGVILDADRLTIRLRPETVQTDVAEFREALRVAHNTAETPLWLTRL